MSTPVKNEDWTCGGWEAAEKEKLQRMAGLTFEERMRLMEDATKQAMQIKAWRHSHGQPTITQNDEIEW